MRYDMVLASIAFVHKDAFFNKLSKMVIEIIEKQVNKPRDKRHQISERSVKIVTQTTMMHYHEY